MDENGGSEQIRPIGPRWPNEPVGQVEPAKQTPQAQSPQLIRPVHLFQPSSLASVQPAQRPPLAAPQPEQSIQPVDSAQSDQPTQPAQLVQPAEVAAPAEPVEVASQATGSTAETGQAKQPSQPAAPSRQSQSGGGWVCTDSKPIRPIRHRRGGLLLLMIVVGAMLILVPVAMMISTVVGKIATYNKQVQTVRQF